MKVGSPVKLLMQHFECARIFLHPSFVIPDTNWPNNAKFPTKE